MGRLSKKLKWKIKAEIVQKKTTGNVEIIMNENSHRRENRLSGTRNHVLNIYRNESQDDRDYRIISINCNLTNESEEHRAQRRWGQSRTIAGSEKKPTNVVPKDLNDSGLLSRMKLTVEYRSS